MMNAEESGPAWHEIVCDTLKRSSVPLMAYVPDNVFKPLINAVWFMRGMGTKG